MISFKENWATFVALSTAAMAVLAAITTLYMGKYSGRTLLLQAQQSDMWAFYQAKSIKSHGFELQKKHIELELLAQGKSMSKEAAKKFKETIDGYQDNLVRYDKEKKEIKAKADGMEIEKQTAQARTAKFSYGLIFLQIAIMLSSIAAITKKRELWYMGMTIALIGVFFFADGFYLFY